jgi:hypothetical protein
VCVRAHTHKPERASLSLSLYISISISHVRARERERERVNATVSRVHVSLSHETRRIYTTHRVEVLPYIIYIYKQTLKQQQREIEQHRTWTHTHA